MNKKKIIGLAGAVVVCILVFVFIVIRGKSPNPAENPEEMLGRIENALGDEYKKQSMTELVATLKYGDEEGNEINYYILKTTYYEADPAEITGLNTEAIKRIVNPDRADSCQKMKIQDWDAALYERGELSYLCWTYSPEVSYILEYSPYAFADAFRTPIRRQRDKEYRRPSNHAGKALKFQSFSGSKCVGWRAVWT